jgi:hypothetical protein
LPINIFMMKPCIELSCPDYQDINADILTYLKTRTEILQRDPRLDPSIKVPYPNFVDTADFAKHNPKLMQYFSGLGLKLFQLYYAVAFIANEKDSCNPLKNYNNPKHVSSCPIHLDRPPVQWKMNWPVMNMIGTGTRFYQFKNPDDKFENYVVRAGTADSVDNDIWCLPYEPFNETHRHIFGPAPILMNGLVPHDVWFSDEISLPRIGLQIMFFKEPRHLLDSDCIILD